MSYQVEVLADAPVFYCPLNEASGNLLDRSSNANDATYAGARGAAGPDGGKAITLVSTSALPVDWPTTAIDTAQAVQSWEIWVRTTQTPGAGQPMIFGKTTFGTLPNQAMYITNQGAAVGVTVVTGGSAFAAASSAGMTFNDGLWHHVVTTYDGANINIYIDGLLRGGPVAKTGTITANANDITAGLPVNDSNGAPYRFVGDLAHAALYTTVLSPARILAHFRASPAGLADTANLTDTFSIELPGQLFVSDSLGLTDTIERDVSKVFSDNVVPRDSATKLVSKDVSDAAALTESFAIPGYIFPQADLAQITDTFSISWGYGKDYSDLESLVDSVANRIIVVGTEFTNPYSLTGSGAQAFTTVANPREAGEPVSAAGVDITNTVWFRYTPAAPGTLTLATDPSWNSVIEVYEDTGRLGLLADLELTVFGSGLAASASLMVSLGSAYYIRVHPFAMGTDQAATLAYGFAARVQTYTVVVLGDLPTTPGTLRVNVTDGAPNEAVTFSLDGVDLTLTGVLDGTGQLLGQSLPIGPITVGAHTLTATTTSYVGSDDFLVLAAPVTPTGLAPPVAPIITPTVRWRLQDAAAGGATYTFPNNPSAMTSPHRTRTVTAEATVSIAGQGLTWEGSPRPHSWEFTGYCGTEAFHEQLRAWANLNRRFYLTDHRNRTWTVGFDDFDAIPRRDLGNDWAHDYTMHATIYGGPS